MIINKQLIMSMKIWETIIQQRKGEGNKTAVAVTKLNDNKIVNPRYDENSRYVEEIIIPPEQREEILIKLRRVL